MRSSVWPPDGVGEGNICSGTQYLATDAWCHRVGRYRGGPARVAKLADAGGLNPLGVHSPCGFESRPGHTETLANVGSLAFWGKLASIRM